MSASHSPSRLVSELEPLLQVNQVTKYYGDRIGCEDISFTLWPGEVLGIAGLVGAGRTELVRAIFGADPIDSGTFYLDVTSECPWHVRVAG